MAMQTQESPLKNVNAPQTASEAASEPNATIRTGTSLFDMVGAGEGQGVQAKVAFMGDIRQKLAQIADEAQKHGEEALQTENLAASSATRLYKARIAGTISADELTGLLGDIFGYKPKADGTPGRTPMGVGDAMRKRVVRALQGWDYIHGGDGGRFYETMAVDDVAPVINSIGRVKEVQEGDKKVLVPDGPTVWGAYKTLADLKSQSTVRVEFAFDPKKIAGLVDKLSEAGARDKLIHNRPLIKAYKALFDQLQIISHVDANEEAAVAQALGITSEPEGEEEEEEGGEQVAA